jgi:predicted PurR-regulated permease PerM
MKDKYKPYLKWGLTIFLTFVCCSLFFFIILRLGNVLELLRTIRGILSPIIWGIVIAYLLWPLIKIIRDRVNPLLSHGISSPTKCKKISLSIGVVVSLALMIFFIAFLLNMVLPELIKTTVTFINHFDEYTTTVESWVTRVLEKKSGHPDHRL